MGEPQDGPELTGRQPMTVVPVRAGPGLQHTALARPKGAATVNKFLGHVPDLGHVEVPRHRSAARQGNDELGLGLSAQAGLEFAELHEGCG